MKKVALIAALVATVAAPAYALSASTIAAIQHFNLSAEHTSDLIRIPDTSTGTVVSTEGSSPRAIAARLFNASADRVSDLVGLNGATVVSGTPAHGADIFVRLNAAALGDE